MSTHLDTGVRFAIAALVGGLWQAPLFAIAAWLVLRIKWNANATTRHSVFAAALFASLILPIVTATLAMRHTPEVAASAGDVRIPRGAVPYKPANIRVSIPANSRLPEKDAASTLSVPSLTRANLSVPRWLALGFVGVWLAGAALVLLRLSVSLLHLERLKRDALPLAVDCRAQLTRWTAATKGGRNVRLCTSDEIDIPIAVGLFDAMILVPKRLLEELGPHDVDSIVLHELAHLRRSDDWLNALERFAHALLFFNPAIVWLSAQLDIEREVACDDWVLQQNDALPYATCLAKVAETAIWPHRAMTAPGAFVTRRGMSISIERLLAKHRDVRVRTSLGPAGSVVAMLAVVGIVAAFVSPSIAYSTAQQPMLPTVAAEPAMPVTPRVTHTPQAPQAPQAPRAPHAAHVPIVPDARDIRVVAGPVVHPMPNIHPKVMALVAPVVAPAPVVPASPAKPAHSRGHHVSRHRSGDAPDADAPDADSPDTESLQDTLDNIVSDAMKTAAHSPRRAEVVADANSPDYIDELESAGYTHLSVDDLIKLKSVGVTAAFIRELQRDGFEHPSVEDLVQLRALGIDPQFISAMRARYGSALSVDKMMGMKAVGVTPAYIGALSAAGLKDLSPDHITSLRALGVTPDYIAGLAHAGYTGLTVDQIQQMRALGIDGAFITRANAHGFHNLTIDQLTNLKATGVL